jgi:hypothetical protein
VGAVHPDDVTGGPVWIPVAVEPDNEGASK